MIAAIPSIVSSVASGASEVSSALGAAARSAAPNAASEPTFGQMLDQITAGAVDSMKSAEAASIAGIQGKVPIQTVVDKIMAAERTLQTVVALRDKAVGAYQEISRMSI